MINSNYKLTDIQDITVNQLLYRDLQINKLHKNLANKNGDAQGENAAPTIINNLAQLLINDSFLDDKHNQSLKTYESLVDIRLSLAQLMETLSKTDYSDFSNLESLDEESNQLIDKIINIMNSQSSTSVIDYNFTNIFLESLNSLKNLKIQDDEYLYKLKDIILQTQSKENSYWQLREKLCADLLQNSENINKNVHTSGLVNSKKIVNDILLNNKSMIDFTMTALSPDIVLGLIKY